MGLSVMTGMRIRPASKIIIKMASRKNPFRSPRVNDRYALRILRIMVGIRT
jgi:hypothetical protein